MYQLFFILLIVESGSCLRCYNCKRAVDGKTCINIQVMKDCDKRFKQPVCTSSVFETERNVKTTAVFAKTCMEYSQCLRYCSLPGMSKNKCKTDCCDSDECNKDKFMDFEQRAKRYSTQVDNTNNHDRLRTNKHLVLLGFVVTFLLGYTEIK